MALNWKSVAAEHVRRACEIAAAQKNPTRSSGLVIWHADQSLPAKEVLRIAYRIANKLPEDAQLRFSSGDATLRLLSQLGFNVERLAPTAKNREQAAEDSTN